MKMVPPIEEGEICNFQHITNSSNINHKYQEYYRLNMYDSHLTLTVTGHQLLIEQKLL